MPARDGSQPVRLGRMVEDGVAPAIFGVIERGVTRDPALAASMRGRVVFRFREDFSPLRIAFRPRSVLVEDGDLRKPDLAISGSLPDIVHFATVPTLSGRFSGVPNPIKSARAPRPRPGGERPGAGRR
jgi:hypothetical protein